MTKLQKYTTNAFLIGLILIVLGVVLGLRVLNVDIFWCHITLLPGAFLVSIATILSVLNPIDENYKEGE